MRIRAGIMQETSSAKTYLGHSSSHDSQMEEEMIFCNVKKPFKSHFFNNYTHSQVISRGPCICTQLYIYTQLHIFTQLHIYTQIHIATKKSPFFSPFKKISIWILPLLSFSHWRAVYTRHTH